jgi:hypothetical protein
MAAEPNLPRLKPASTVTLPAVHGTWVAENLSLDRLADSLFLPPETLSAVDLKSIPDVWAQPLVFANALRRSSHPMHEEAVRDWRALLALLGLAATYQSRYQIDLRPADLTAPDESGAGRMLKSVLTRLPPRKVLPQAGEGGAGADWSAPLLLMVRGVESASGDRQTFEPWRLAGLLSPATLVSAAKTSASLRLAGAPWMVDGLSDPTGLGVGRTLPRSEYAVLARFLDELRAELQAQAAGREDDALYAEISGRLDEYARDCRKLSDGYDQDKIEVPAGDVAALKPLYRRLKRAPRVRSDAYGDTHSEAVIPLRALPGESGESPFEGVLLLDPAIAHTYGRHARDVHVWRQDTLASLEASGQRRRIEQSATEAGYLVVTPDDFFTREFIKLGNGGVVAGHDARHGFANAVLPVSPLALLVHEPRALQEALSLEVLGDGGYTVSLELPLNGAGRRHVIRRTFRPGAPEGFAAEERGVWQDYGVATWPDIQYPDWRWNFLRLASNPNTKAIRPRFGVSAQSLSRSLALETAASRADKARAWIDSGACLIEKTPELGGRITAPAGPGAPTPPLQRLRYRQEADTVYELQLSTSPFEAVALARSPEKGVEARPVGLILLDPGRKPNIGGAAPTVAVDFGTTNTVACVEGEKEPLQLRSRVRAAISNPKLVDDEKALAKWSLLEFFPLHETETPMPTVAKRRVVTPGAEPLLQAVMDGDDERALFSDLIYFQPPGNPHVGQTSVDIEKFAAEKDNLVFDLKWGRANSEDRARGERPTRVQEIARRFIRQFMMMASVELLERGVDPRRVSWRFSYPEAMRDRTRNYLEDSIRRSWRELFEVEGRGPAEGGVRDMIKEGAAAAKYFIGLRYPGRLLLVFDIGGGTTDIAVLKDRELVWRGSFRLAGGDFLTHYIMNNPEFFEDLKLTDFAQLRRGFSKQTSSLYGDRQQGGLLKSFGELLFSDPRFSRAMTENYQAIQDEESGEGLRHSAWVYLGGMAFYMGLVVRSLIDQGVLGTEHVRNVGFGLGGRGATFFKQFGGRGADSALNKLLGCFNAGGGFTTDEAPDRRELMSDKAKLEVVLGMLSDQPGDDQLLRSLSERLRSDTPVGETLVRERDGSVLVEPRGSMGALESVNGMAYPDLGELQRFLTALTQQVRLKFDLKPDSSDGAFKFIQAQVFHGVRESVEEHQPPAPNARAWTTAPP